MYRPNGLLDVYVGLKNHYITISEVLNLFYKKEILFATEQIIVDLEAYKDSEEAYLEIVHQQILHLGQNKEADFAAEMVKSEKWWQLMFLKETADSDCAIEEKLNKVENLWARFNYPEEWEKFIYYMPNETAGNKSKESVYKNLLDFLKTSFRLE